MGWLIHIGIAAAYAVLAVLVAMFLPGIIGEAALPLRLLSGLAVFLAAALVHEVVARRRGNASLRRELGRVRNAQSTNTERLQRTSSELATFRGALGFAGGGSEADLVGEMRVIRGLLKKITDGSAAAQEKREGAAIARANAADQVEGQLSTDEILDITRAGLESNRVDLYLQPIVSLPQRKVRYYEVFSRIRNKEGSVIVPEQYLHLAEDTGLISTIDNLLLFRCIQLVRRARRDKVEVGVFVNLLAHALMDPEFFPQFLEFLERNRELSESLLFELSQEDAVNRNISDNLAALRRIGFAFSMDKVTSLDLDFDNLARSNFRFIKIEAGKLLSQNVQQNMTIHITDLKEALKRAGMDLIAEKVEEENEVLGLLEFNVDYGQGFLFGEPRPARDSG